MNGASRVSALKGGDRIVQEGFYDLLHSGLHRHMREGQPRLQRAYLLHAYVTWPRIWQSGPRLCCRDIAIPVGLTRCGITIHLCCATLAMDRLCPRYVDSHTHEPPCGFRRPSSLGRRTARKLPALPRTATRPSILIPCLRKPLLTAPRRAVRAAISAMARIDTRVLPAGWLQEQSLSIPPPPRGRGARIIFWHKRASHGDCLCE